MYFPPWKWVIFASFTSATSKKFRNHAKTSGSKIFVFVWSKFRKQKLGRRCKSHFFLRFASMSYAIVFGGIAKMFSNICRFVNLGVESQSWLLQVVFHRFQFVQTRLPWFPEKTSRQFVLQCTSCLCESTRLVKPTCSIPILEQAAHPVRTSHPLEDHPQPTENIQRKTWAWHARKNFCDDFAKVFQSFIFIPAFSRGRVAGTAAPGGLEMSNSFQRPQTVVLAPRQNGTKQVRRRNHATWCLVDLWAAFRRCTNRTCLAYLSWYILVTWPNQLSWDIFIRMRSSLLYEFHSCALCREAGA